MPFIHMRGVRVPHRKNTSCFAAVAMPDPQKILLPVSMHIGAPAAICVKTGDKVKIGDLVASASGVVSSPVYASVSGTVTKTDVFRTVAGGYMSAVEITSDGLHEIKEDIRIPEVTDLASFTAAVRDSGVVGLGGAGFPSAVKLAVKDVSLVDTVIINGAECEPYITSDTRTMTDRADDLFEGIRLIKKYLEPRRTVIAVEDNKKECASLLSAYNEPGVEILILPSVYPQGGEKVLIFNVTGKIVPEGKLPLDVGAVVLNCTTLASIGRYIKTGMPLTVKCVTVDGSAVKEPKNVLVPIGTPISDVLDFCGLKCEPRKVFYGGPMMGITVPDTGFPVMKTTNAILAFDSADAEIQDPTPCIKCGRCAEHCPLHLTPFEIERAYTNRNADLLKELKVNLCMECGCCSYECPAHRQLVQTNKTAKSFLRGLKK